MQLTRLAKLAVAWTVVGSTLYATVMAMHIQLSDSASEVDKPTTPADDTMAVQDNGRLWWWSSCVSCPTAPVCPDCPFNAECRIVLHNCVRCGFAYCRGVTPMVGQMAGQPVMQEPSISEQMAAVEQPRSLPTIPIDVMPGLLGQQPVLPSEHIRHRSM